MPATDIDPRVDAYIAAAQAFARPLLEQLRANVHGARPGLQETIKWGMPFFMYGGRNLCHMAAFKAHCAFGFWQGSDIVDTGKAGQAMGQYGRLAGLADLPPAAELQAAVREAVAKIDALPPPRPRRKAGA